MRATRGARKNNNSERIYEFRKFMSDSVAEWSECRTRNPAVPGSSPALATCWIQILGLEELKGRLFMSFLYYYMSSLVYHDLKSVPVIILC